MYDHIANFTGFTIITALFLAGGIVLVAGNHTVGSNARRAFLLCLVSLFFISLFDWINYVFATDYPSLRWFHIVTNALTFTLAPVLPAFIAHTIYPDSNFRVVATVLVIHAILEFLNIFFGFIFWIDESNRYFRGSFYWIYMATYIMSAIYLSVESIRAGAIYQSANLGSILIILAVLGVGVGIQVFESSIRTTWPAVSMAVVLYFLFYTEMVLRTDALTKLLNRHSYEEFLAHPPLPCTIVLLDVDNFKYVNDTYGHAIGDICLSTEAALIRRAFGSAGLCYRTGGDEFTVVVSKQFDQVDSMVANLKNLVAKTRARDERIPSMSVGIAVADEACTNIQAVIEAADQEMYEAKRAARAARK